MSRVLDLSPTKMLTVDELVTVLSSTEPVQQLDFPVNQYTEFQINPDWSSAISDDGLEPVEAWVKVPGAGEYQLTADALGQIGSQAGIQKSYLKKCPSHLMEPQLNYWYRSGLGPERMYKLLIRPEENLGVAFTKDSIVPFSNLSLLEQAVDGFNAKYGVASSDLRVDSKYHHDLRRTHFRLIYPGESVEMNSSFDNDLWSPGVQVDNSLTGELPTKLDAYAVRWLCANGMADIFNSSGKWNRRTGNQDEIFEWARASVDEILQGYDDMFRLVDSLNEIKIDGDIAGTMEAVFDRYSIPSPARRSITHNLIESDDDSMYGVLNAVTQAANQNDLSPNVVGRIFEIGGEIVRDYGEGKVVFEALEAGTNLDLSGYKTIVVDGQSIETKVRKIPSD